MINPREQISSYAMPVHLLWGLMLMKVYATEDVLANIAKATEKTFRKWAWAFIDALADLSYTLVSSSVHESARLQFALVVLKK